MTFRLPARTPPTVARPNQALSYTIAASLALTVPAPFRQTDWPNPQRPRAPIADQLGYLDGSETWLFSAPVTVTVVRAPFYVGLQKPGTSGVNTQALGSSTALLSGTVATPAPFRQTDWTNPQRPRPLVADQLGYIDGSETWLFAKPFAQLDWANPRGIRALTTRDQISSSTALLNSTVVASPFNQTDWANPRGIRALTTHDQISPSIALLYAGTQVRAPVFGALPKPGSYAVSTQLLGSSTALLSGTVVTPAPFNQTDWPNPQRARGLIADQLGYIDPSETWLVPPFKQLDWPNPQRRVAPAQGWTDSYKSALFTVAPTPFYQTDWPNPRGAVPAIALKTFTLTLTGMIGQDVFYGAPGQVPTFDWQNPVRAKSHPTHLGFTDSYKLGLFQVTFAPFAQLDWPNPVTRPRALIADQLGYLDASEYWLFNAINPFFQVDWPNPVRSKPAIVGYAGHVETYKIGLYQIVFVPFAQTDWPNPVRARGAVPHGFTNPISLELIGQDRFYGAPGQPPQAYDWPTPRTRPALVGHLDTYKINLFASFAPFAQTDWPNPRGPRSLIADQLGYLDSTEFWLFAVPFNQTDWPNPRGATRSQQLGWHDVYKISLFSKPFAQTNWPNPSLGKQPASDLRTFVRPIAYQLIGQDKFFGPPGMPPTYDWPNPVRARRVQQPTSFATPFNLRTLVTATSRYAHKVVGTVTSAIVAANPVRKITGMAIMARIIGRPDAVTFNTVTVEIIGSTLMTVHDPLDFVCGDNWALSGPLQDANGAALNLTGATISWKLDSIDGTINYLTLSLGSGISVVNSTTATILVEPTHVQTAALAAISYRDSLRVTLSTGEVFTEWSGIIRASKNPA